MTRKTGWLLAAGRSVAISALLLVASAPAAVLTGSTGSHDPSRINNCGGTYYVYSTGGGMKSSTDRVNWSSGTSAFPNGVPASIKNIIPSNQGIWAPDVIFYNNKYYLYYAVAGAAGTNCAIGLLTSPTLNPSASNYKWTDVGVVIYTTDKVTRRTAIDPCPFLDASNNLWLSWGSGYANGAGYYTNTIYVSKLDNTTGLSISAADTNGATLNTALTNEFGVVPGHIEASFVYYHGGYYYVFWNSGGCCSGSTSTYTIHMARSTNATGPYFDESGNSTENLGGTTFLGPKTTRNSVIGEEDGPGQIGILSEGGIDRFTYHYYPLSGGPNGGANLGEETLIWGANGWPSAGADLSAGTYKIGSLNNGLVLGVHQAGTAAGTPLDQETYTGGPYQQWTVAYTTNGSSADGYYSLTSVGSGLVADVYQSGTADGTLIDQWTSTGGNNQKWFIEETSEGYYRLTSHLSPNSVMDVTNFSDASGTWLDERGWSNTVNQQWVITGTGGSALAAPVGLTATAGIGQIVLNWSSASGATQYHVERGTTTGGPYANSLGSPTSTTFTDTSATNGITYYYAVSAVNASGISGRSAQADATVGGIPPRPAAPTGLTAATVSSSQINLNWIDNATNETSFLIESSPTNANTFAQIDSVGAGVTNYSNTGLLPGTFYYYRVRASNTGGNSAYSNTNGATTLPAPAGLVTNQIVIANYSFETNSSGVIFTSKVNHGYDVSGSDVAGWLNAGTTYNDSGVDYAGHSGITAQNGTAVAYCDGGDGGACQVTGYLMQAGDQLTLTWWAKSSYQNAGQAVSLLSGTSPTTSFGSLTALAAMTTALNNTGNGGAYTQYTLNYTAVSTDVGRYVAVFFDTAGTNGQYAMFDDFSLTVVSTVPPANQPVIGAPSLSNSGLILSGTGGSPGANFYLLGTTNISLTASNWMRLLTNQFDNNGDFNFTNPMDPAVPQMFYQLQQP